MKLNSAGSIVWNKGSGASTQTTNAVPSDSTASVSATSAVPASSAATIQDTHVPATDTHATVTEQSESIPPATITDLTASSPTYTSTNLTWTAPGDVGMSGIAAGYVLKYSASGPITDSNWGSATIYNQSWTPAKNGTLERHVISSLKSNTTYWFAVKAFDNAPNYSDISNSPSATTRYPATNLTLFVVAGGAIVVLVAVAIYLKRRKA